MGLFDKMQAPARQPIFGAIADALGSLNDYANRPDKAMPGGMANPPLSMLAQALSLPALAKTADRVSYGDALTNSKAANVPFFKPETADAMMMAPLSPRTALGAVGLAAGMGDAGAMRAATVWHGSPHKFDKFDASKIGTGEGAQAYGHGLYLAESPDVAKSYQEALARTVSVDGKPILQNNKRVGTTGNVDLDTALIAHNGNIEAAIADAKQYLNEAQPHAWDEAWRELQQLEAHRGRVAMEQGGALYKVDLPDEHIAKMLDWDKPLHQQPEVMRSLGMQSGPPLEAFKDGSGWSIKNSATGEVVSRNWGHEATARKFAGLGGANEDANLTGQAFYRKRHEEAIRSGKPATAAEKERQAAEALRRAGIPGIRYLDGGSRTAGQGSSNFVVFPGNEGLLNILERNGQPLK